MVSEFTGGAIGLLDGAGPLARFAGELNIAVATNGLVFVSDSLNNNIRKIAEDGLFLNRSNSKIQSRSLVGHVSMLSGSSLGTFGFSDGFAQSALFHQPLGIAVQDDLTLFVADSLNYAIRRVSEDLNGNLTVASMVAGRGYINGFANYAALEFPRAVSLSGGNFLVIVDTMNYCVRSFEVNGT